MTDTHAPTEAKGVLCDFCKKPATTIVYNPKREPKGTWLCEEHAKIKIPLPYPLGKFSRSNTR
jgi:hypothetical protein